MQLIAGWSVHTCTPGNDLVADDHGLIGHVAEAAHADAGEGEARAEAAARLDACIDDAGTVLEADRVNAELGGAGTHVVCGTPRAIVHRNSRRSSERG